MGAVVIVQYDADFVASVFIDINFIQLSILHTYVNDSITRYYYIYIF